ncbi:MULTISPECIES: hypothetical protein [Halomonadaceae]|nr:MULTISPECIES: hypothetical protein [Halomonas]QJQ94162.1 hypothetical protein HIO72_01890 [Halomonas sp. PA5]
MDAYFVIIDSHWMASRLPRSLAMLQNATSSYPGIIEVQVVAISENTYLSSLSRRYGARFSTIALPSIGARSNEIARRSRGRHLVFATPRARLSNDWIIKADQWLSKTSWDAVILRPKRKIATQGLTRGLRRLWPMPPRPGVLCVAYEWFERIGGFDPALDDTAHQDLVTRLRACQARVLELEL